MPPPISNHTSSGKSFSLSHAIGLFFASQSDCCHDRNARACNISSSSRSSRFASISVGSAIYFQCHGHKCCHQEGVSASEGGGTTHGVSCFNCAIADIN